MRRSQLTPELRSALRSVEFDIDLNCVAALMRLGHTEESAKAHLRAQDMKGFQEMVGAVRVTITAMTEAFRQATEAIADATKSIATAWTEAGERSS